MPIRKRVGDTILYLLVVGPIAYLGGEGICHLLEMGGLEVGPATRMVTTFSLLAFLASQH